MPSSARVTQLFSSLMRVYRTFPPVAPKTNKRLTANRLAANRTGEIANYFKNPPGKKISCLEQTNRPKSFTNRSDLTERHHADHGIETIAAH